MYGLGVPVDLLAWVDPASGIRWVLHVAGVLSAPSSGTARNLAGACWGGGSGQGHGEGGAVGAVAGVVDGAVVVFDEGFGN